MFNRSLIFYFKNEASNNYHIKRFLGQLFHFDVALLESSFKLFDLLKNYCFYIFFFPSPCLGKSIPTAWDNSAKTSHFYLKSKSLNKFRKLFYPYKSVPKSYALRYISEILISKLFVNSNTPIFDSGLKVTIVATPSLPPLCPHKFRLSSR